MSLNCYKYHLPFNNPLETTKGTFDEREGLILEFITDGESFYGEAAPLPGFSDESLADIETSLTEYKEQFNEVLTSNHPIDALTKIYQTEEIPPALQFGLDTLGLQLTAYHNGSTLQEQFFSKYQDGVPINALGNLLADDLFQQINQFRLEGFATIKFKIGLNFRRELQQLQQLRSRYPDLTIRLDANQAWTIDEAISHCKLLEELDIEYCEEPLGEPSPEKFEKLATQTTLPLALDESIRQVSYWPNLLPYSSFAILKPMLLGSFTKNLETKALANTHNNKVVYTTSLESGIGRQMTALLASGSENSSTAHGLTTGRLFTKDVYSDKAYISGGTYNVRPLKYRLQIDLNQLQHLSTRLF